MMKIRYAMFAAVALASPAYAAPPNQVFEFDVVDEDLETSVFACTEHEPSCTIVENTKVPYVLGILTLTHDSLTTHQAVWIDCSPNCTDADDGHVVSFVPSVISEPPDPRERQLEVPFEPTMIGQGWTVDLKQVGNRLSGTINIGNAEQHGSGCVLQMMGTKNNWTGTWWCGEFPDPTTVLHRFSATLLGSRS